MAEPRLYQSANGSWIVFDGQQKHFFGGDEAAANQFYRRLLIMSAITSWQEKIEKLGEQAEALLPVADAASDMYAVNGLQVVIDTTPAGELVGDSTLTKEAATLYHALQEAFLEFVNSPVGEIGLTAKQILRLRG